MCAILPKINPLSKPTNEPFEVHWPVGCLLCGSSDFKKNGTYSRKTHIGDSRALYPIPIQRCYCYGCKQTFSILPEWLPPRRWYIWKIQEQVLLAHLLSNTMRMISKQYKIARSTVGRWLNRFKEQFDQHADQLKQMLPNILGRTNDFISFWQVYLSQYTLAQSMRYLSNSGIEIP